MKSFYASSYLPNALNQKLFDVGNNLLFVTNEFLKSNFLQVNLMNILLSPKGLSVPQMDRNHRIGWNFKHLLGFTGKPLGLVLGFPVLLVFFLTVLILSVYFFFSYKVLKRIACDHEMVFTHSHQ
jgi:hypothetical protein